MIVLCRFFINFALRILLEKEPTVFRITYKQTKQTIATNEGCQLTPYRGVGIGGIRQCRAGLVPCR